jgi:hypothetical protein
MTVSITLATETDALELAMLRKSVSEDLTRRHGQGHWSHAVTERGVLRDIRTYKEVGRVVYRGTPHIYFEQLL